jgi:CheY-like chemotaxis protein/anti-sigma regulatory factor (Ser/Thr protein kinase)
MLQEEADDLGTPEIKPDLQKIHGAGKHLLGLINDILDLSKIEAGKMSLYLETFEIQALLNEVAATVQPLVQKNGNQLILEVAADIGSMHADITKIRQTLFNLLSNASKFTDKGTVRLRARRQAENLVFEVIDSGIGMTPEQVGRLFQAFAQADSSTSKKYGGTGLGLALSRKFCQLMGGDMTVSSEAGKGSTFTATIPAQVTEAAGETASSASLAAVASSGSGPLVLVIDDDATVQDLLRRSLNRDGFRVETAPDGASGLAQARALRPAIITLDVMMPGMDGWEVLAALKEDPATSDIPVIVMSIVDEKGLGFSLGAADYLTKPLDFSRLTMVVKRHATTGGEHTILVVEDDPATQDLVSKQLEKEGWRVVMAGNGREAMDRVSEGKPDLVLLDLMMPEMDGFEFLEAFRKQPGCARISVVVMTAKILTDGDRQRLRGQVAHIVEKAVMTPESLVLNIRNTLQR